MSATRNDFLDHGSSEESANEQGYDSEAAEVSKTARSSLNERANKRRKLSHSSESEDDIDEDIATKVRASDAPEVSRDEQHEDEEAQPLDSALAPTIDHPSSQSAQSTSKRKAKDKKPTRPGVIYLSSLPPYLRPSALRNILTQRGFTPITRLFLAPISTTKSKSKSSRQMYSEGWIEFASHKTAKRCVDALNAAPVGGKKGSYYRDDVWNMRYLKGMGWRELMEGVAGERREEEGRRDEERRRAEREAKVFVEGVDEGRRVEGMREKRRRKGRVDESGEPASAGIEVKRTWRQFEAKGNGKGKRGEKETREEGISQEAREVLGKIF